MAMDTSYLTTQVTSIIGQLHGIFDEIGIPRNEREAKETEVQPPVHHCAFALNSQATALFCAVGYFTQPSSPGQFGEDPVD